MEQATKPFPLLKYFSVTSLLSIFITTIILCVLYWNVSVSNIIWHGERSNTILARTLSNTIWQEFRGFLFSSVNMTDVEIRNNRETQRLHAQINSYALGTPVLKVEIFDLEGKTIYSSDTDEIGIQKAEYYSGRETAHTGKTQSKLSHRNSIKGLTQTYNNIDVISTFIPIKSPEHPDITEGVFEIYIDATEQVENLKKQQIIVFLGIFTVLMFLYLVLHYIIKKADQTIKQQADEIQSSVAIINSNYDVLERRTRQLTVARDTALEANRAKSAFLANMSHELRTPLNAIIGYSELMSDEIKDQAPESLEDLKKINNAGIHLLNLINNILDISKIEAGKMENHIETVYIHETVSDVVSSIEPLVAKNDNKIIMNASETLGTMECDITKLRQILFNLISNASKFTTHGTISVSVSRIELKQAEWLEFRITDTGIGMTPDQLKRLFKPFSQADSSTTKKYGGTGLGLAISRRLSELLGGSIKVNSQLNEGSSFTVILPSIAPHTSIIHKKEPIEVGFKADPVKVRLGDEQPIDPRRKKISTVLVIDDNADIRDLMERFLTRQGFFVHSAASAVEGIELANRIKPDIITLDVMMPEKDGWSTLTDFKNDPELNTVPIIMLTLSGEKDLGMALGAADFLTKPIDWKVLHDSIITQLRRANMQKK